MDLSTSLREHRRLEPVLQGDRVRGQHDRQRLHGVDRPVGCRWLAQDVGVQIVGHALRDRTGNESCVRQIDLEQPMGTGFQEGERLGQLRRAACQIAALELDHGRHIVEAGAQHTVPHVPRPDRLTDSASSVVACGKSPAEAQFSAASNSSQACRARE